MMQLKKLEEAARRLREILAAAGFDEKEIDNAEAWTDEDGLNARATKEDGLEISLSSGKDTGR
jgi:hypothetical protein